MFRSIRAARIRAWLPCALVALSLVAFVHPSVAGTLTITRTDYTTLTRPVAIAVADANVDGKPDVVIANTGAALVSVFRGTGSGFSGRLDYALGTTAAALAIGDLNLDGQPDIVACSATSPRLAVLLGNGSGGYASAWIDTLGSAASALGAAVVVGDWNGDGYPDVAVAVPALNAVEVQFGHGDGRFSAPVVVPTGSQYPLALAALDVDGDGHPDLVAACAYSNTVVVLHNDGSGTFALAGTYGTDVYPAALAVGDVNNDGHPDLVTANTYGNDVSVLLADGAGGFLPRADHATANGPKSLAIGDLDGDGDADLAVACATSGVISLLTNDGTGGFLPGHTDAAAPAGLTGIALANVTNGASPNVLGTSGTAAKLSLYTLTAPARIALVSASNPVFKGQPLTLTATVTPGAATGTVTFYDGSQLLTPAGTLTGGVATWTGTMPAGGTRTLTAVYGGDATYNACTSPPVLQVVATGNTMLGLGASPNPAAAGATVTLVATVTPSSVTGSVTFRDAGADATLGTAPLAAGTAVLQTNALAIGAHTLVATFGGSAGDSASNSPPVVETVQGSAVATTTTLTSSSSPVYYAQPLLVTVSVAPSAATGRVVIFDGTAQLASALLVDGQFTLSMSFLAPGSHTLTAQYLGDAGDAGSTSAPLVQVVKGMASTTTTLTANPKAIAHGGAVTLTATVTPSFATGDVTFRDGATVIGTAALGAGVATLVTSTLSAGTRSLYADYPGDADDSASTSARALVTVMGKDLTSTVLTTSPNPCTWGQTVTLTATVTPGTASGFVHFREGSTSLGSAYLTGGTAAVTVTTLAIGTHTLVADYLGDLTDTTSTSNSVTQVIAPRAATTTQLVSDPNPSVIGHAVTLTATVSPSTATGTITFRDGGTTLATLTAASGVAQLVTSSLTLATHTLYADYSGDAAYANSTSPALTHVVSAKPVPAVALAASPNPGTYGDALTLTAILTPAAATGAVNFRDGNTALGSATLGNGVATLVTSALAAGVHALYADYLGDATYSTASSTACSDTVAGAPTVTTLTASQNPSWLQLPVVFTATVRQGGVPIALSGNVVTFDFDGVSLGAVTMTNGVAQLTRSGELTAGSHAVRAHFVATGNYGASDSPALTQVVLLPVPALRSVADVPNDQGRFVRLTVARSAFDSSGVSNAIQRYSIFRQVTGAPAAAARGALPTGSQLAGWEQVGGFDAYRDSVYLATAPTLADSNASGTNAIFFFVRAATLSPGLYFDSAPVSGWSVDNLPPATPAPFRAAYDANAAHLHWGANGELDFAVYRLYRGASADFTPGAEHLLVQQPDTGYVDASAGAASAYYKLSAVDLNGDESPSALVVPPDVPPSAPVAFALEGAWPNPALHGALRVSFALPSAAPARLDVIDVGGRCVRTLDAGTLGAGRHVLDVLEGGSVAPGVYVLRLTQGASVRSVRAVVLR